MEYEQERSVSTRQGGPNIKVVAAVILVVMFAVSFLLFSQRGRDTGLSESERSIILESLKPNFASGTPQISDKERTDILESLHPKATTTDNESL